MPPEVLEGEQADRGHAHALDEAALDGQAVVQAQHHARRERIAGAVAALDVSCRDPHRGLPPGSSVRRRGDTAGAEVDHGQFVHAQPQQLARRRQRILVPGDGGGLQLVDDDGVEVRQARQRQLANRAASTQTSSRLVRRPAARARARTSANPLPPAVGRSIRSCTPGAPRWKIGGSGREIELLLSRAARSHPGSGRRCDGRCRARSSRRCRPSARRARADARNADAEPAADIEHQPAVRVVADQPHHLHGKPQPSRARSTAMLRPGPPVSGVTDWITATCSAGAPVDHLVHVDQDAAAADDASRVHRCWSTASVIAMSSSRGRCGLMRCFCSSP